MKRDNKLMQSILKVLEDSESGYLTGSGIRYALAENDVSKDDAINHHIHLLADRGLVDISDRGNIRLTWDGHEALKSKASIFG
ncbi:hypothetical protein G3N96_29395 [Burkholderia sp. Se-20373]|uniref:hypothetical protein n=1 Tax=Burkholderia sp. Se-20373 TaxID=2703898 RepID=UPI00197DCB15|nr:hypothetical protein [Burkholderia sp. Se-20373]MBN3749509.1 hypothetical protein [Burkholderia sp. Se-20373]